MSERNVRGESKGKLLGGIPGGMFSGKFLRGTSRRKYTIRIKSSHRAAVVIHSIVDL